MPAYFKFNSFLNGLERVEVLEFDFCAEHGRSFRSYRDISIATKASFFHIAVTNVEILKGGSKSSKINSRFFGASNIGFTYDLQQRYAGAVQIDETRFAPQIVNVFSRVLFYVDSG